MAETIEELSDMTGAIDQLAKNYSPGEKVAESLSSINRVAIIGPLAVGKTTCMLRTQELDSEFAMAGSFTTRDQREGEPEGIYRFLPHDRQTLQIIQEGLERRELVQAAVHPVTGFIYGSEVQDYPKPYTLLDTLANTVEGMRRLPFGGYHEIALVTPPEAWWSRLEHRRRNVGEEDINKRVTEARSSLEWCLDQGPEMPWVVNSDGKLDQAAQQLIDIVRGSTEPDPRNREIGTLLLKSIAEA